MGGVVGVGSGGNETTGHPIARPAWVCAHCGGRWPCAPARAQLLERVDRGEALVVARQLGRHLVEAVSDRPDVATGVLYRQILGWLLAARSGPAIGPGVSHGRGRL
jgi:hypothetical protein